MVWEKGQANAIVYALEVRRRTSTLNGSLNSMEAHQEARDAAMSAGGTTSRTARMTMGLPSLSTLTPTSRPGIERLMASLTAI